MFSFIAFLLLTCLVFDVTSVVISGTQGGVDDTTGFRPMRLEINQFSYAGPAWDLYVLALRQFQSTSQSGQLSYYEISGIHGYPNGPWDGVTGNGGGVGYCTHGSVLFPVWHRPYLALFENLLWNYAQDIAAQYSSTQRATYQSAAVTMRIPYWDWSTNSTMPDVATSPKLSINTPQGRQNVDNPLYNYTFHPLVPSDLPDEQMSNAALNNAASYWHDNTFLLFSSEPSYQAFSNVYGGAPTGNTIENIHGGIHNYVGGASPNLGHMTLLWYSAMDPIFWLHHANVDRVTAIWQAIHPDSYVVPQASQMESTYYTAVGTIENATYPLAPFHSDNSSNLHTALSVQYLKPFGYTYPELFDWTATSPTEYSQRVTAIVNQIYHPNYTSGSSSLVRRDVKGRRVGAALAANWEWVLSLKVDCTAIPEPMTLYFFTSTPPASSDPNAWGQLPTLVGSQLLLYPSSKGPRSFSPPRSSIPLTPELLSLPSLEPGTVNPWIGKGLVWRAVPCTTPPNVESGPMEKRGNKGKGKDIPSGAVTVRVKARKVTQTAPESEFPVYGKWEEYGKAVLMGSGGNLTFS
ncbi:hypothetical protein MMC10_007763 [Thelotrema lepadinum]|nr:hypothetical protein [Thelotrema lepadinum]